MKQEIKEVLLRLDELESEQVVELKEKLKEKTASRAVLRAIPKALEYEKIKEERDQAKEALRDLQKEVGEFLSARKISGEIYQKWNEEDSIFPRYSSLSRW